MTISTCPNCNGENLFRTREPISSGGGYSPNYLPGLGGTWGSAKVRTVVCQDCGLIRYFAESKYLRKLGESGKWERAVAESPSDW